jgi:hypothetical protein
LLQEAFLRATKGVMACAPQARPGVFLKRKKEKLLASQTHIMKNQHTGKS